MTLEARGHISPVYFYKAKFRPRTHRKTISHCMDFQDFQIPRFLIQVLDHCEMQNTTLNLANNYKMLVKHCLNQNVGKVSPASLLDLSEGSCISLI